MSKIILTPMRVIRDYFQYNNIYPRKDLTTEQKEEAKVIFKAITNCIDKQITIPAAFTVIKQGKNICVSEAHILAFSYLCIFADVVSRTLMNEDVWNYRIPICITDKKHGQSKTMDLYTISKR